MFWYVLFHSIAIMLIVIIPPSIGMTITYLITTYLAFSNVVVATITGLFGLAGLFISMVSSISYYSTYFGILDDSELYKAKKEKLNNELLVYKAREYIFKLINKAKEIDDSEYVKHETNKLQLVIKSGFIDHLIKRIHDEYKQKSM